jgi:hypothetical protein
MEVTEPDVQGTDQVGAVQTQTQRRAVDAGPRQRHLPPTLDFASIRANADALAEVERHRLVLLIPAGQLRQDFHQEANIVVRQPETSSEGGRVRNDALNVRVAAGPVDAELELPTLDSDADVTVRASHTDRLLVPQVAQAEGGNARHQHVIVEGEVVAALDEQLSTVRGDDLSGTTAQLQADQREPRRLASRASVGGVEGREETGRHRCPSRRQFGQCRHTVGCYGVELPGVGRATIVPACHAFADVNWFEDDEVTAPSLELLQGVGAEGEYVG